MLRGEALDVALDIRFGSPTFGKWASVLLSGEKMNAIYIPAGFAHAFLALSDEVEFLYKCSDFYDASDEGGVFWNDPALAISWGIEKPLLSSRDSRISISCPDSPRAASCIFMPMSGRILLIGKTGQVGSELAFRLLPRYELTALGKAELDLANPADIRESVARARPAVIINCAAYTRVDEAESHENLAFEINATAPAVLAEEARKIGAALIHYSTDYVFDGEKRTPYLETDSTNPISAYGREQVGRRAGHPNCWNSAPHFAHGVGVCALGRNFLLTILRLATERSELRIVNDQFGAPTTNLQIRSGDSQDSRSGAGRSIEDQRALRHLPFHCAGRNDMVRICQDHPRNLRIGFSERRLVSSCYERPRDRC